MTDVYYLTNAFFEERWKPIRNEAKLKAIIKKCSEKPIIVKMQISFEDCELHSDFESLPIDANKILEYEEETK